MSEASWRPPADEELTWFRGPAFLPARPRPLELALAVGAFVFGVSRALESLYFPTSELRGRLFDGELYLSAAPSALAERDLAAQHRRIRDNSLRFVDDVPGAWRRVQPQVAEYTAFFEGFASQSESPARLAEQLARLKRVRANQWFAPVRAVVAPAALLGQGLGRTPREAALQALAEVRTGVIQQGEAAFSAALLRLGRELAEAEAIDAPEDVLWLDQAELKHALETGEGCQAIVARRKAVPSQPARRGPEVIGPPLPADAPCLYLIDDILKLLEGEKP